MSLKFKPTTVNNTDIWFRVEPTPNSLEEIRELTDLLNAAPKMLEVVNGVVKVKSKPKSEKNDP